MLPFLSILPANGLKEDAVVEPFGKGLIISTWKINNGNGEYILQRVNQDVLEDPSAISHNVRQVAEYLQRHHPGYMFVAPLVTNNREEMYCLEGDCSVLSGKKKFLFVYNHDWAA